MGIEALVLMVGTAGELGTSTPGGLGFGAVSTPAESEPVVDLHRGFQVLVSERGEHRLVIGYEGHVDWVDVGKKMKTLGGYYDRKFGN